MNVTNHDANYDRHLAALRSAMNYIALSSVADFIDELYLYGSFSRGNYTWESDIDLFLVLHQSFKDNNPSWKEDLLKLRSEISGEEITNVPVDLKIVFGKDWQKSTLPYYQNIRKDGKKLW